MTTQNTGAAVGRVEDPGVSRSSAMPGASVNPSAVDNVAKAKADASKPEGARHTPSTRHGIVVLDFGGQYTQLIARRIREEEVFSAILPCTAKVEEVRAFEPVGIVLSGGPSSGYDAGAPHCDPNVLQL